MKYNAAIIKEKAESEIYYPIKMFLKRQSLGL